LSEFPIDMSTLKNQLQEQFKALYEIEANWQVIRWSCKSAGSKTKGLDNLEKRLLKAQKRKLSDILERITDLQNELFLIKVCRNVKHFSEFYLENGSNLIPSVIDTLKPLEQNFNVITLHKRIKASQKKVLLLTTIKQK
jgi:predicted nucleic-acid-binding Zn-ribbon protein